MHIAIIGMGPAAVSAAEAVREEDKQTDISMFSAEDTPPYSPPCLGDYLLTGNTDTLFWQGVDFAERYKVDCHTADPVRQLSPNDKKLTTKSGKEFTYDKMIIASGSSLYAPVLGSEKQGVLQFKNFAGAKGLRDLALEKKNAKTVIVGGGFIGVEIALYLAKLGAKPVLLNRRGWIMPRLLDPETSEYVLQDLESQGVEVRLNTEGTEFVGEDSVEYLLTNQGERLEADVYIAATGIKPNIEFLRDTDIKIDHGILVDNHLLTSHKEIYACGDVAQVKELITGENKVLGLYPLAVRQGRIAGKNVLGLGLKYQPQPSMNSLKGLGFKLIVAGQQQGEEIVYKGNNCLQKFFVEQEKLQGFVLLGDVSDAGIYMNILQNRKPLDHIYSLKSSNGSSKSLGIINKPLQLPNLGVL